VLRRAQGIRGVVDQQQGDEEGEDRVDLEHRGEG
jgi:hypothetical protein